MYICTYCIYVHIVDIPLLPTAARVACAPQGGLGPKTQAWSSVVVLPDAASDGDALRGDLFSVLRSLA